MKTKYAVSVLSKFEAAKGLFVDVTTRDEANGLKHNDGLRLAVRNLNNAKYIAAEGLNVEDILKYDLLFVSKAALEQIQGVLNNG